MTAQAQQSNNALGRRSLPSVFFAPLETIGRYMERQQIDNFDESDRSGKTAEISDSTTAVHGGGDPAAVVDCGGAHGAFAEVALRVWGGNAVGSPEGEAGELKESFENTPAAPMQDVPQASRQAMSQAAAPVVALPVSRVVAMRAPTEARRDTDSEPESRFGSIRGLRASGMPTGIPAGIPAVEESHALAHDASNLLSALRLYSELLCFSGVLHERHRHYAEDLKLLSLRSEKIIGRLLRLAEEVAVDQARGVPSGKSTAYGADAQPFVESSIDAGANDRNLNGSLTQDQGGADVVEIAETASLAAVMSRLKGLLGTIAQGPLQMDLGDFAAGSAGRVEMQEQLRIAAPAEAVERILVNLVSNAAAAIRDGGAVRIRAGLLHGEGDTVPVAVLTVDDSGCGMSEAQVRAALGLASAEPETLEDDTNAPEPVFASLGKSGRNLDGVAARRHGLGLSIVRELVASTGGRLLIHSYRGTGTRVEIRWAAVGTDVAQARRLATLRTGGQYRQLLTAAAYPRAKAPAGPLASYAGATSGGKMEAANAAATKGAVA